MLPTEELARRLTTAGVEVGAIISSAGDWAGVTVAEVVDIKPHPDAERLVLVAVRLGDDRTRTVVCGAPNVAVGQRVAFGPVGTRYINGHTGERTILKKVKIRGVESAGMIMSEKELGISDEHEGIRVLPEDAPVGEPLASILGETIFDLDLTPNRPDLLSVLGVAREVAALSGSKVRDPSIVYEATGEPIRGRAQVDVLDRELCPRYVAALVEGVKIAESPAWMQQRLIAAGMRPINNVVDITNYVMLEMGQPLHAFDFAGLKDRRIVVRRARRGESLRLLDGTDRELSPEMLVIADADDAVGVAGVMGGAESEVTEETETVLLESANFRATSIRRTRQALKVETDASKRFEKGLSVHLPPIAAERAVKLIARIVGYDELPTTHLRGEIPPAQRQQMRELRERVRHALAASGLREVITYSLTDLPTLQKVLPPEDLATSPPLRIANPMSREFEYARTTLRGSILQALAKHIRVSGGHLISVFEAGRVYLRSDNDLPHEIETVCAALSGRKPNRWGQPTGEPAGFFEAKAHLEHVLAGLRVAAEYREAVEHPYLSGRTAEVAIDGRRVGLLGELHPRIAASFEIKQDVAMFELDLEALMPHVPETVHYEPVSPYPSVEEDLAIILDEDIPAGRVIGMIEDSHMVRSVSIFDVYTGPPVPKGKKSLAFSISFQSGAKTLTDEEVAEERRRIVQRLRRELGAELRS